MCILNEGSLLGGGPPCYSGEMRETMQAKWGVGVNRNVIVKALIARHDALATRAEFNQS